MSVYQQWSNMTTAEKAIIATLLVTDPIKAALIKLSKDKAFNETTARFGYNGHNDQTDAFRHCFWSATLARDIGIFWAKAFTDAHETNPGQPANEKAMDLHNNAVGLDIGFYYFIPDSDRALSNKCFSALQAGKLQTSP